MTKKIRCVMIVLLLPISVLRAIWLEGGKETMKQLREFPRDIRAEWNKWPVK